MSIKNVLKEIVENVDGALGAIVMGYDGIPLDEYITEASPIDLQVLSVEYATVLKEIKKSSCCSRLRNNGRDCDQYGCLPRYNSSTRR
jgi:predicted regulator of Ras-like GTPase activity (Roadblock/LC7/MglB family)